jgi:hypothetical protein
MRYYLFNQAGVLVGDVELDPYGPIPALATTVEPPAFTPPQIPAWRGGDWVILDEMPEAPPPSPPVPPPPPVLERQAFVRLFTSAQILRLEPVVAEAAALTKEQMMACLAGTGTVAHGRLLVVRAALRQLDTADVVDFSRTEVIAYLATLRTLEVIESDAELTRIATGRSVGAA